jgi:hypothetical protein
MEHPVYFRSVLSADPKDRLTQLILPEGITAQQMASQIVAELKSKRGKAEEPLFLTQGPDEDDPEQIEVPIGQIMSTVYAGTVASLFPAHYREMTSSSGGKSSVLTFDVTWEDVKPAEKVSCGCRRGQRDCVVERSAAGTHRWFARPPPSRAVRTASSLDKHV